jgi:hypothetical protein
MVLGVCQSSGSGSKTHLGPAAPGPEVRSAMGLAESLEGFFSACM